MPQQIRPMAWNFEVPEINRLIQPIEKGYSDYRAAQQQGVENERQNKLLGFQEQRLGMDKQKFNASQESERLTRLGKSAAAIHQMPDGPDKQARAAALLQGHADLAPQFSKHGIDPSNPVGAVGLLAQSWGEYDPLAVRAKEAQIASSQQAAAASRQSMQQSAQMFPGQLEAQNAQAAQIRQQTPEWRMQNASRFGIDTNTPEGKAFIVSGQYAPKSDTVTANEGQTIYQTSRDPTGRPTYTPIVQGAEKPPAEHTAKAANFAARMVEAERNIRKLVDGKDPINGAAGPQFGASDKSIALTNPLPETVRNMVISPQHQQYRQAAEQWIRAFLRKESGAAIGADEFKRDFVVYFPQPGDSPQVQAQKQEARAAAMSGIAGESGAYFKKLSPDAAANLDKFKTPQQSAAPSGAARPRAVNKQTGQTIEWDGSAWVPAQ